MCVGGDSLHFVGFDIWSQAHKLAKQLETLLKSRRKVGHLHYFNKEIAEATLETCGYKIIDSRITAGCLEFSDLGVLGQTYWLIGKLCSYLSPSITARVFGGFSLLVLAEGE